MDCAVSAYINYLRIAGRANPALLAGSGNSDARHTDKLFFANRTFIAALIAIKSAHQYSAHIHAPFCRSPCRHTYCRTLHSVWNDGSSVLPPQQTQRATELSSFGHSRFFAFQQRCNRVSILIVGIVVAVRRRLAVRFGIFSTLK